MPDNVLATFKQYAGAFEEALDDNNWARIAPYFADHALYLPGDGRTVTGRDSIIDFLKDSVESLDRKFDRREFLGPPICQVAGEVVTMNFAINYAKEGLPDLKISGKEIASFEAGLISRLEDQLDEDTRQRLPNWLEKYGGQR
ncbi:MAG: hypothetical protein AAF385_06780 [Pseudomonadota bacterium]